MMTNLSATSFGVGRLTQNTLVVVACLALGGCIPRAKPGSSPGAENSPDGRACPKDGVVDDGEDGNNQVIVQKGRSGYWYTFVDKAGSSILPTAGDQGGTFTMAAGGASASAMAAHMTGKIGMGSVVFAGMGLNFTDPKGAYDASAYKGIAFWAKKGEGTGKVRLKVPDTDTDPDGKVCTECFNDFGADLELSSEWAKYVVPFSTMKQMPSWGSPRPPAVIPSKLYGVQFQANTPGASFDIWVDDLQFTGCP
jgi:endoglucanase